MIDTNIPAFSRMERTYGYMNGSMEKQTDRLMDRDEWMNRLKTDERKS